MKKITLILTACLLSLVFVACASNNDKMSKDEKPHNIDKNNVGITKGEVADQSDPSIIEGNLEDNDFKN